MVRPTNLGRDRELLTTESSTGTFDAGDNGDWTTAPDSPSLIVEESDGSPTVANVGTLIFDAADFTVTDNADGTVRIDSLASANAELNIEGGQSVISAHGTTGATETIDPTAGNVHTLTLDADCTVTLSAPVGSGAATLELWVTEDGTGGWGITWPGSVTEEGTHDTTAGTTQRVILESVDGGTSWIATWIGSSSGGTPASTVEAETTFGISPAVGADTEYARQDHTHGTPDLETSGHWEVLMDGGSPPEPLEDGSGTDWLYVWVP